MKNLRTSSKGEERRTFLKTALTGTVIGTELLREPRTAIAASWKNPLPELPEGQVSESGIGTRAQAGIRGGFVEKDS